MVTIDIPGTAMSAIYRQSRDFLVKNGWYMCMYFSVIYINIYDAHQVSIGHFSTGLLEKNPTDNLRK